MELQKNDHKIELLIEGLRSYPDVKRAIQRFENIVKDIATRVLTNNLTEWKYITEQPSLDIHYVDPWIINYEDRVGIGFNAPETSGIDLGIRWIFDDRFNSELPHVFVAVHLSANYKISELNKALSGNSIIQRQAFILKIESISYQLHLLKSLPDQISVENIEKAMEEIFVGFINMVKDVGNLKEAILGK